MNGSSRPEATAGFSARAIFQLHAALHPYLTTPAAQGDEAMTAALEFLCLEAHRRALGPEKILGTVQSVWPMLILQSDWSDAESRTLYERVAKECIRIYFDSSPSRD